LDQIEKNPVCSNLLKRLSDNITKGTIIRGDNDSWKFKNSKKNNCGLMLIEERITTTHTVNIIP